MDNILGFYVFDASRGWLQDDEKTWAFDFHGANSFNDAQLANDVGERQSDADHTFYVLACLGSM